MARASDFDSDYGGSTPPPPSKEVSMGFKLTLEDWIIICILAGILIVIGMLIGCGSVETIQKPYLPKIKIEEPVEKAKPTVSVKGPKVVNDIAMCMNVPPEIVCKLTGDFGELVHCITECGIIVCVPGDVILCPNGLCYTADP